MVARFSVKEKSPCKRRLFTAGIYATGPVPLYLLLRRAALGRKFFQEQLAHLPVVAGSHGHKKVAVAFPAGLGKLRQSQVSCLFKVTGVDCAGIVGAGPLCQHLAGHVGGAGVLPGAPVNPVDETGLKPSRRTNVLRFKKDLEKNGINGTIRREMGRDIDGACGQLRRRFMKENGE